MAIRVRVAQMTANINGRQQTINVLIAPQSGPAPSEELSIEYQGTTATISGLASTNVSYNGTTATVGGNGNGN